MWLWASRSREIERDSGVIWVEGDIWSGAMSRFLYTHAILVCSCDALPANGGDSLHVRVSPRVLMRPKHTQRARGCCWQSRAKHHTHTRAHTLHITSSILHNADSSYIFIVVRLYEEQQVRFLQANYGKCTATMFSNNNLSFGPVFLREKGPLVMSQRALALVKNAPMFKYVKGSTKKTLFELEARTRCFNTRRWRAH